MTEVSSSSEAQLYRVVRFSTRNTHLTNSSAGRVADAPVCAIVLQNGECAMCRVGAAYQICGACVYVCVCVCLPKTLGRVGHLSDEQTTLPHGARLTQTHTAHHALGHAALSERPQLVPLPCSDPPPHRHTLVAPPTIHIHTLSVVPEIRSRRFTHNSAEHSPAD